MYVYPSFQQWLVEASWGVNSQALAPVHLSGGRRRLLGRAEGVVRRGGMSGGLTASALSFISGSPSSSFEKDY